MKLEEVLESYKKRIKTLGITQLKLAEEMSFCNKTITMIFQGKQASITSIKTLEVTLDRLESEKGIRSNKKTMKDLIFDYKVRFMKLNISNTKLSKSLKCCKATVGNILDFKTFQFDKVEEIEEILKKYE